MTRSAGWASNVTVVAHHYVLDVKITFGPYLFIHVAGKLDSTLFEIGCYITDLCMVPKHIWNLHNSYGITHIVARRLETPKNLRICGVDKLDMPQSLTV